MSNVILFPKVKRDALPQSMEELIESVETTRRDHIELFMDDLLAHIFDIAADEGFPLTADEHIKSTSLLVESLRSALYKSIGLDHPLQEMAEEAFKIVDSDQESVDIINET